LGHRYSSLTSDLFNQPVYQRGRWPEPFISQDPFLQKLKDTTGILASGAQSENPLLIAGLFEHFPW